MNPGNEAQHQITRRFAFWTALCVFSLNALAFSIVFLGLNEFKKREVDEAVIQCKNTALGIHNGLNSRIENIDFALLSIVREIERSKFDNQRLSKRVQTHLIFIQDKVLGGYVDSLVITDKNGDLIYGGKNISNDINLADREYFRELKRKSNQALVLSDPIQSRSTGQAIVVIARSYKDSQGNFAGAVLAPVPLAFFNELISSFDIGERSVIGIRTDQFDLIARNPSIMGGRPVSPGDRSNISQKLRNIVASGDKFASYQAYAPDEGVLRTVAVFRLDKLPLIIIVGLAQDEYLAQWYKVRRISISFLVLFMLATCLAGGIIYRSWRRRAVDAALLNSVNLQLKTTIEEVSNRDKSLLAVQEVGMLGTFCFDAVNKVWTSSAMLDSIIGIDASYPRTVNGALRLIFCEDKYFVSRFLFDSLSVKGEQVDGEFRIVRSSDAAVRWVHLIGKPDYGNDGVPRFVYGAVQDITEIKESRRRVEYLAYHDGLTHLPNRTSLIERIEEAMPQSVTSGLLLGICCVDFDDFNQVNDKFGPEFGDRLLIEITSRLKHCIPVGSTLARIVGDEFAILFEEFRSEEDIMQAVEHINQTVSAPFVLDGNLIQTTLSIGVTIFPKDSSTYGNSLIRHAEHAMFEVKRNGKNQIRFYDPEHDKRTREKLELYSQIVHGLARSEFVMHYQPKVELTSGRVMGVEALMRWQHPEKGLLMPGAFLQDIEEAEFSILFGNWVLDECFMQQQKWQQCGINLMMSINIFGKHLQHANFLQDVKAVQSKYPSILPDTIQFEIVETTAMENLVEVSECISECKRLGIGFSLDDFGTGYSSLTYFRQLPINMVKIDRSFVIDMLESDEDKFVVKSVVEMARGLDRRVIAEGVETIEHGVCLQRCGCDILQGYAISKALPAVEFEKWIKEWRMPIEWVK